MRLFQKDNMTKKEAFSAELMAKVAGAAVESRDIRINENFRSDLEDSPFIPILFETERGDVLDRSKVKSKPTDAKPIVLELQGGEKIEIGRYSKPGSMSKGLEYGMAWRILGQDPHGAKGKDQLLIQHPWIMLEHLRDVNPVSLEKTTFGYGEAEEILRWMATFNPKDILVGDLEFSHENYPKILALKSFGRSIVEAELPSIDPNEFKDKLSMLEQYRRNVSDIAETGERYELLRAEVNRLRSARTMDIESFDELYDLFDQDYLRATFGDNYKPWVHDIYVYMTMFGSDMNSWTMESLEKMMVNPENEEPLAKADFDKLYKFMTDNALAITLGETGRGTEMVTDPRIVEKIKQFPDD